MRLLSGKGVTVSLFSVFSAKQTVSEF